MSKVNIQKKPLANPKGVKAPEIEAPTLPAKLAAKRVQNPKTEPEAQPPAKIIKTKVKKQKFFNLPEDHEKYFVYLKNPMEYRRQLLESSRKILYCLRAHQKIIIIRQKKLDEMRSLKNSIRELIYLNKKFNEMLPKYDTGFLEKVPSEDRNRNLNLKALAATKQDVEKKYDRTELEKLEESLAGIEKKLRSLQ